MRHRIAAVSFVLVVLIAGGVTIAVAGSTRSNASITKARAVAFARTVNLGAADLPRFRNLGLAPEPQPRTNTSDPEFARCVGVKPNRYVASVQSPGFIHGRFRTQAELVTSKVIVLPTASLAARELTMLNSVRGRSCFARLLIQPESASATESHLRIDRVSWSSPALPPAAHGFKVRVAGALTGIHTRNRPIHLYIDMLGFINGAAQVYLVDTGWESPARSSTERRLISLLYSRAEAHKLS
jgi:hypothetical protein